jgi:hypothetical protein
MRELERSAAESIPEAQVTLHLAFWLLDQATQVSHVDIAIDGAHVLIMAHEQAGQPVKERRVFLMKEFLALKGCRPQLLKDEWRGTYGWKSHTLTLRSTQGFDVQGTLNGQCVKAECKGGPLTPIKGKSESAIFATAIGQVVMSDSVVSTDALWVAVPDSPSFEKVGTRIVNRKTFQLTGIRIVLVSGEGRVRFLN